MNPFHLPRRALAPFVLALALAGCGGHGGGSSSSVTPAAMVASEFSSANVSGSFDTPDKAHARSSVPTVVTVQFSKDNTGDTGVASFVSGSAADPTTFAAYAADISNVAYTITSNTATAITGTISYDLNHFTTNKYFTDTSHFTGTYTIKPNAISTLVITGGTFTGKDPNGAATTATVPTFNFIGGAANIDLSGTYGGSAAYSGVSLFSFTGATLAKVSGDGLHLNGTIPFTPPGSTTATSLTFNGAYTRSSLSGATTVPVDISFSVSGIPVTIPKGTIAQVYLTTTDNGKTITGSLLVDTSLLGNVVLSLSGTKSSASTGGGGGGGTTTSLKTGYYDGGIKAANGQLDGRILKLNVTKASATVGNNGGMIIVTGSNFGFNIGGRVASVTGSGSTATVTIDQISGTYSKIVMTGTVSGTAFNASYTATRLDGTTETGSLDQFGQGSTTTTSLTGTWSGSAVGGIGTSTFSATFKSNGDGTVLITPTSTVGGGTNPTVTLPPFTAYQAGSSFAGHISGTANGTSLGQTIPVSVTADFDGDVSGSSIAGDYIYSISPSGSTNPIIEDSGTLALTKH